MYIAILIENVINIKKGKGSFLSNKSMVNFLSWNSIERFKNGTLQGSGVLFFEFQLIKINIVVLFSNSLLLKVHESSRNLKIFENVLAFCYNSINISSP